MGRTIYNVNIYIKFVEHLLSAENYLKECSLVKLDTNTYLAFACKGQFKYYTQVAKENTDITRKNASSINMYYFDGIYFGLQAVKTLHINKTHILIILKVLFQFSTSILER